MTTVLFTSAEFGTGFNLFFKLGLRNVFACGNSIDRYWSYLA